MDLISAKLIAMIALGSSSMLVGLLPNCFTSHSHRQWPLILSLLLCFGGGVLMSTSVVHMLPEIRASMTDYQQYAEVIFCLGYFLVYIIDELVHFFYGESHDGNTIEDLLNSSQNKAVTRRHSYTFPSKPNYGTAEHQHLSPKSSNYRPPSYNPNCSDYEEDRPPSQLCHVGHQEPCDAAPIGNVGLLIALCIHSLLEGLAIGLQGVPSQVLLLLGAVASHKLVVGFCLGVELATSPRNSVFCNFMCITTFALGSVAGIGVGMVITKMPQDIYQFVLPIVNGLAAGTLLYVTVSEVLPRERARWHLQHHRRTAGLSQLTSVICGFLIMTAITIFVDR